MSIKLLNPILILLLTLSLVYAIDSDNDGVEDFKDKYPYDFDNDGLPDQYEFDNNLNARQVNGDTDSDGLKDLDEYKFGSNPQRIDSDDDGLTDKEEYDKKTNPNSKYSPLSFNSFSDKLMIILTSILIFIIFIYLLLSRKNEPKEKEDLVGKILNKNKDKISQVAKKVERKRSSSTTNFLKQLTNIILGPNIKEAKKKKQEEKEERERQEEWIRDEKKLNKIKKRIEIKEDEKLDLRSFLMRILNKEKRKKSIKDVLELFDKEVGKDELTFFKERRTKKEIIEWLHQKKELKKKLLQELKRQEYENKKTIENAQKKQIVIEEVEEEIEKIDIFKELEKVSDDVYERKLKHKELKKAPVHRSQRLLLRK